MSELGGTRLSSPNCMCPSFIEYCKMHCEYKECVDVWKLFFMHKTIIPSPDTKVMDKCYVQPFISHYYCLHDHVVFCSIVCVDNVQAWEVDFVQHSDWLSDMGVPIIIYLHQISQDMSVN